MWVPLAVLAVLSVFGGYLLERHEVFRDWLYPGGKLAFLSPSIVPGHPHLNLVMLSFIAATSGVVVGAFIYWKGLPKKEGWDETKWSPFRRAAARQFGYDAAVVNMGVDGGRDIATGIWKVVDVRLVDAGANGLGWLASKLGQILGWVQTGYVRAYALMMLAGGVGFLGYFLYVLQQGAK